MKMKILSRSIRKELTAGLFLAVLMVLMLIMTGVTYAAATHTVSGTYDPKDSTGKSVSIGETTYKLYHVGDFDEDNKAVFKLLPQYQDVEAGLNFKKADFDEEGKSDEEATQWREAWMSSAETLSNYVKEENLVGTVKSSDGKFRFTGVDEGLFLLTGTSNSVTADGKTTYWWPRPMYVRVLSNDDTVEIEMKPKSENAIHLTIHKSWDKIPDDMTEMVKPDSINVRIYYGASDDEHLKETVTLDDKNNWMYSWDAEKGETDSSKWIVQEDTTGMEENFDVEYQERYDEASMSKVIDIKNVYNRKDLEIVKTMKDYVSQGNTKQTFVFQVVCFAGQEEVLRKYVGVTFGENDDEDKALVSNIPKNVDKIEVTETYSGNYKPDAKTKEAKLEATEDGTGKWTVAFENSLDDDTPSFDTGVINQYSITGDGAFSFNKSRGSGVE